MIKAKAIRWIHYQPQEAEERRGGGASTFFFLLFFFRQRFKLHKWSPTLLRIIVGHFRAGDRKRSDWINEIFTVSVQEPHHVLFMADFLFYRLVKKPLHTCIVFINRFKVHAKSSYLQPQNPTIHSCSSNHFSFYCKPSFITLTLFHFISLLNLINFYIPTGCPISA